jgi:lysozyme family protein
MNFDEAFAALLEHEGGYSNHAADPGGKTRYGITEAIARQEGYTGDMRDYPLAEAKKVYKRLYWDVMRLDEVRPEVRFDLFDAGVNSGVGTATRWAQRILAVRDDGVMGPITIQAIKTANPALFRSRYNGARLKFMAGLRTWEAFSRGWANRIADNLMRG